MKNTIKFFSVVFLLSIGVLVNAQNVNIPDDNMKSALLKHNPKIDLNNDMEISVYEAEKFTGVLDLYFKGIEDLTGIEKFINITGLNCGANNLTNVDFSKNTLLEMLDCSNNKLSTLDVSLLTELQTLNCHFNLLSTLDVSSLIKLESLSCFENSITSLKLESNSNLIELYCSKNQLKDLDLSKNLALEKLTCNGNQITKLDLSSLSNLVSLDCSLNQLTILNIANGNNSNMHGVQASDNPELSCIQHDAGFNPTPGGGWFKDDQANWNTDCGYLDVVEGVSLQTNAKIYPNPANEIVHIDCANLESINLYNWEGRQVLSTTYSSFDISGFPSGIYTVKIASSTGSYVYKKLMVK